MRDKIQKRVILFEMLCKSSIHSGFVRPVMTVAVLLVCIAVAFFILQVVMAVYVKTEQFHYMMLYSHESQLHSR
jgi:hypothetical protein